MEEVNRLLEDIKDFLKNNEDLVDMEIAYLLVDKDDITNSIAFVCDDERVVEIKLKDWEYTNYYDWSYDLDTELFDYLMNNKEIGYMSLDWHYNVWSRFEDIGIGEFSSQNGIQKYLQYCKDNSIDKEYLDEKLRLNVPDAMKYLNELKIGERVEYKGYIVEIDEYNSENLEENIVQIFENEQKYIDGEHIESVSLSRYGLKKNIQDYIEENYYNREKDMSNEMTYISFVLGYDLLNDMFKKSKANECDTVYDFCNYLTKKFVETDYYKDNSYSMYSMLEQWVNENKEIIQSEYLVSSGLDDKKILEIGTRGDTKVALVERNTSYGKEYAVAFHYEVDEQRVNWGYGYYYDNNFEKAKEDFERAKLGESLADTFTDKKKNKFRER